MGLHYRKLEVLMISIMLQLFLISISYSQDNLELLFDDGEWIAIEEIVNQQQNNLWSNNNAEDLLFLAISKHQEAIALLLIEFGAFKNIPLSESLNELFIYAVTANMIDVVMAFLDESKAADNVGGLDLREALQISASRGSFEIVEVLIDNKVIIDLDQDFFSPLQNALFGGHSDIALYLINNGANIDADVKSGETILSSSIASNDIGIIRFILDKGLNVDVNEADSLGGTLMLYAVIFADRNNNYNLEIFDLLISNGADPCEDRIETSTKLTISKVILNTSNLELKQYFEQLRVNCSMSLL